MSPVCVYRLADSYEGLPLDQKTREELEILDLFPARLKPSLAKNGPPPAKRGAHHKVPPEKKSQAALPREQDRALADRHEPFLDPVWERKAGPARPIDDLCGAEKRGGLRVDSRRILH